MINKHFLQALIFCFTGCLLLIAFESNAQESIRKEYLIGPGDIISIQVWDHTDLNRTVEISQQGDFTFPLIGKVHGSCLSVFELEKEISQINKNIESLLLELEKELAEQSD